MWNKDEAKGKMDRAKGHVKDQVGKATGDDRMRGEGKAEEIGGNAREAIGKGKKKVGDALDDLGDKMKR
jgi:uncharacterized protein YjbJ (UPF0337 family)